MKSHDLQRPEGKWYVFLNGRKKKEGNLLVCTIDKII